MNERRGILWFVLDETSAAALRRAVAPLYPNEYCHHVTLRYGVAREEVEQFIGKKWEVVAHAVAWNDKAQACPVETNGLPDEYGVPHVTVSTAKGVKPFASVAMLQGEHKEESLDPTIVLAGTVEFVYLDEVKD